MTLKERLKEIKQRYEDYHRIQVNWGDERLVDHVNGRDVEWMIDRIEKLEEILKRADKHLWFDAERSGACMYCDANLHPNAKGKHQQLNGDPCFVQEMHDLVEGKELNEVD